MCITSKKIVFCAYKKICIWSILQKNCYHLWLILCGPVWYIYVDIFAILPDNLNIQDFLAQLNSLSPSINFRVEMKKKNQSLPFPNHLPSFAIYRKPTHSNMYRHVFNNCIFMHYFKCVSPSGPTESVPCRILIEKFNLFFALSKL